MSGNIRTTLEKCISDSARYHSDANIALGPILKMYIPGQIRIFNALNSDGYSTGNAPPSGNNAGYHPDRSEKYETELHQVNLHS